MGKDPICERSMRTRKPLVNAGIINIVNKL